MPATLESCGNKQVCHIAGIFKRYKPRWNTNDISIIMLTCELCNVRLPANCGSYTLVFVSGDGQLYQAKNEPAVTVAFAAKLLCNDGNVPGPLRSVLQAHIMMPLA